MSINLRGRREEEKRYDVNQDYLPIGPYRFSTLINNNTHSSIIKDKNYPVGKNFFDARKQSLHNKFLKSSVTYRGYFHSETANKVFHQLEYWFSIYPEGFYKFSEPCNHRDYREADSWSEEIGCHRTTFIRAFDTFGVRYKSKSSFMQSKDKFKGKPYASYYDCYKKMTFYVRNSDFVTFDKVASTPTEHFARSNNKEQRLTYLPSPTSPKNPPTIQQEVRDVSPEVEEMIKIWEKEISPTVKSLTPARRLRLKAAYENYFGSSLERWRSYCIRIANNGFLMGNGPNRWKADIFWATGSENIEKVLANTYSGQKEVFEIPIKSEVRIEDIPSLQGDGIAVNALRAIASAVGLTDYNTWMGNIWIEDLQEPIVRIMAPSRFHADRIETNFRRGIREALRSVLPNFKDVDIVAKERK